MNIKYKEYINKIKDSKQYKSFIDFINNNKYVARLKEFIGTDSFKYGTAIVVIAGVIFSSWKRKNKNNVISERIEIDKLTRIQPLSAHELRNLQKNLKDINEEWLQELYNGSSDLDSNAEEGYYPDEDTLATKGQRTEFNKHEFDTFMRDLRPSLKTLMSSAEYIGCGTENVNSVCAHCGSYCKTYKESGITLNEALIKFDGVSTDCYKCGAFVIL